MDPQSPVRVEKRLVIALSVRVYGMDHDGKAFNQKASTLDITMDGARLEGLPPLVIGEIVGVQYGEDKARYKVVWMGELGGKREGQVGLQIIPEGNKAPWHRILEVTPEEMRKTGVFTLGSLGITAGK